MWVCWEGSEKSGCAGRVVRREESGVLVIWVESVDTVFAGASVC